MRNEKQPAYQLLCDLLADRSQEADWRDLSLPDWDLLARIATAEGVAPLAYYHLRGAGWLNVAPASIRTALEHTYATSAMRNIVRIHELGRIPSHNVH